ncbi:inner membrane protein translocase component YidC [Blattabacterium punctulatus CPU2]|uniref:Membrane protein insertase YidC n=1 Tax=Blattabacterium punctulatus CPU2 TaxID=1457032 RepID=A0AAD1CM98_9FLAO|nr:membrane protein insertase YidC [Blattabacterium punctulatus]AWU39228.1 membrane protein insertase YidC [Blattabacterium punctulatus]BBA17885.1 inner membrane protein translocase component YidC [Blattabacterium punctulatus CPU2]
MKDKKLDYQSTIGLLLILFILTIFTYFNVSEDKKYSSEKIIKRDPFFLKTSFSKTKKKINNYFNLENDVLKLKISSLGGSINEVFLKKYKAYDPIHLSHNKNLYLIKNSSFLYNMIFFKKENLKNNNKIINTSSLYFYPFFLKKEGSNNRVLIMRAKNPYGKGFIEYIYTIKKKNQYNIDFFIRTVGFSSYLIDKTIYIDLEQKIFSLEKDRNWENTYTQVYYSYNKNYKSKIDYLSEKNSEEKNINNLNWIANKQQFFTSIFFSKNPLKNIFIRSENFSSGNFLKKIQSRSFLKIKNNENLNLSFQLYFGPLDFSLLKKYEKNIENIIPFGWGFLKWINKYFFLIIFQFLEKTNLNYGIIIILMTIVVKLILSPITYKQYKLSAMMKLIRPEIDELNNKFKNSDPLKKQRATMELYRKAGINPMSGCISTLFQIPIFYSLFKFFPTLINLRGKSFFWVEDLTSYDSIFELPFSIPFYGNHISLLTLLYSLALLIYTKLSSDGRNDYSNKNNIPDMHFMLYLMPIIMLFFINSYASGLSLYYFTSNVINIGLIFFIKKFMLDENKIHQKIQENKKKPIKHNYWNRKIKEMIEKNRKEYFYKYKGNNNLN